MPTPRENYIKKLNQLAARFGKLEDAQVRRIQRQLVLLRKRINAELAAGVTEFGEFRITQQRANIKALIQDFERRTQADMAGSVVGAYETGGLSAVQPLQEIGVQNVFFKPQPSQLNVILDFSSDLITGITGEIQRQVDIQVKLAALGGKSAGQAMKDITRVFGKAGVEQFRQVTTGITWKAEMDIRTELQRVFNLSHQSQNLEQAKVIPGLTKRWIATGDARTRPAHLRIHNQTRVKPIPIDAFFVLVDDKGVRSKLMYPLDPRGPANQTINCRCTMSTIVPEIGVIGSPLDGRIAAEMKRREESEK